MSFNIVNHTVKSTDGIHTLCGKIFVPDGEIKGILHLVHGMTEYIDRYDPIFTYLCERGYVCCGYDNLGHGRTARDDSELGFIAEKDGWRYLVGDVDAFGDSVRKMFPDKDYFLMGHSMGSFIVRLAAEEKPEKIKKLIVCGTGGPMLAAYFGLLLIKIIRKIKGDRYVSRLIDKVAFGAYNNRFDGPTKYEWLTKDREIINRYINDKYCTFKFTVSAVHDLITLTIRCNRGAWFKDIQKRLPILLIAGECDPVGNFGKGVKKVFEKLKKSGCNVKMKLYADCRHEILNDTCKAQVSQDVFDFLKD